MTLGRQIWLACGAMAVATCAVGLIGIHGISQLKSAERELAAGALPSSYLAGRMNTGAKAVLIRMHLLMQPSSPEKARKYEDYLNNRAVQWRKEADSYGRLARTDQERRLLESAAADFEKLLERWQGIRPLVQAGQHQEAFARFERETMDVADNLDEAMKGLVALNNKLGEAAAARANDTAANSWLLIRIVLPVALLAGSILVFFVIRSTNASLRQVIQHLSKASTQVADASSQIARTSQGLAQGASEQAASLEETSASTEEISGMARGNADSTRTAVDVVQHSKEDCERANRALDQMVKAMAEINESSTSISRIIKVIDGIAFQTNILALNAAVEAARAGQSGLGFSVVADEVRNLAQRSAQAARDTTALIETSIKKTEGGKLTVEEVATAIQAVANDAGRIDTLLAEVNAGSQQQATGIEQIARTIMEMEKVTQNTAASAEESAAAAEELNTQSAALTSIVNELAAIIEPRA